MGNDVDDVLALDILYKNHEAGKINLLAITSNKDAEHSTAFIDIMNNFYGFPTVPIGKIVKGAVCTREKEYSLMVASDSTWKRTYKSQDQLPESHKLIRKVLASQKNHSVVIISVGFLSNLSRLLQSGPDEFSPLNGKELVALKVKYMSLMGGEFEETDTKTAYEKAIDQGIPVTVPNKAAPKKKEMSTIFVMIIRLLKMYLSIGLPK
jgi:inosine-uridine nucleoside N-ribohydrolase